MKLKILPFTGTKISSEVEIPSSVAREMGINDGDTIEINGKKKTFALVRIKQNITGIVMNGYIRKNCETSIGEFVEIRKAKLEKIKELFIVPFTNCLWNDISGNEVKEKLIGAPVCIGDILFYEFEETPPNLDFSKFVVWKAIPSEGIISEETEIHVLSRKIF